VSANLDRLAERALRQQIIQVCHLLYQKNLIPAVDGNVSARWGEEYLITTPSGVCKGLIEADDLVVADLAGQLAPQTVAPHRGRRPSAEIRLHLEIYRQRPDVRAVVHTHAPVTMALTVAGISLAACVVPETLVTLGQIATTRYATPTSAQGPEVVRELIAEHDALALDRHGAVTVGRTVFEAFAHMEKVENTATVLWTAHTLGRVKTLPLDEVRRLSAMRQQMLGPERVFRGPNCALCGACEGLPQGMRET
jgi:L-fuculose-phosphate aldolase